MSGYLRGIIEHYGHEIDNNKVLCPFHNENTPSNTYYEETDSWYCHGCGLGGDAINWICEEEDWDSQSGDFRKAVEKYESITGDYETYAPEMTIEELEEERKRMSKPFDGEVLEELKAKCTFNVTYRGIKPETSRAFGVMYELGGDGKVFKSYYPTSENSKDGRINLVGFKVREHPKTFREHYGYTGITTELFSQWKFQTHAGTLMIVGGEIDMLSAYQMLKEDYDKRGNKQYDEVAVVSSTVGENSIINQCRNNLEFINQFRKVIVCLDNDKAGEGATRRLLDIMPTGKTFVMKMRKKDPNEYLLSGMTREFVSDMWGAEPYTPANIISSLELFDHALKAEPLKFLTLPPHLKGVNDVMQGHGVVEGEILTLVSGSGTGKSLMVNTLAIHWALNEPEHTIGVLSLEASAAKYSQNLIATYLGVDLNSMGHEERKEFINTEENRDKVEKLFVREDGSPTMYILDERGADVKSIQEKVEIMVCKLGCTTVLLDPISDIYSGLTVAEQEEFNTWLKKMQSKFGITPVCISHIRKGGEDEHGEITEDSIMGTSFLAKASGLTIALERDKQAEDYIKRNTTRIRVLKNREYGNTGVVGYTFYNREDRRIYNYDDFWTPEKLRAYEMTNGISNTF